MNFRRVRHAGAVAIPPDCVDRISVLRVACAPRSGVGPIAIRVLPVQVRHLAVRGHVPIRVVMAVE